MEFQDGAAGKLEGLSAAVAGDLSDRAFSGDVGERKGLLQPDQQEHRPPHQVRQGRRRDRREVSNEDIIKGYKVDTDTCVTVDKDELDNIALESTRTIDIVEFVPKSDIDELYLVRPYYIVPDGKVGHDAFAVIRETIRSMDKVAIARVVLTNREHIIALEARGKGLVGMLLR
jgi:Ku protein